MYIYVSTHISELFRTKTGNWIRCGRDAMRCDAKLFMHLRNRDSARVFNVLWACCAMSVCHPDLPGGHVR